MDMIDSWMLALKGARRSPATRVAYTNDLARFTEWLAVNEPGTDLLGVTKHQVRAFLAASAEATNPRTGRVVSSATVDRRYRTLRAFYGWLVREEELEKSPLAGVEAPKVTDNPPPVVSEHDRRKLLKACEGKGFEERRDRAIILVIYTTGIRVGELCGLTEAAVNLGQSNVLVHGKGDKARLTGLMDSTAAAIDRYLRVRRQHPKAADPALWIGRRGAMTEAGVYQMLERRCLQAGIPRINPHRFRHTFSHEFKLNGGGDAELMAANGWTSPAMAVKYGRSAVAERAMKKQREIFNDRD